MYIYLDCSEKVITKRKKHLKTADDKIPLPNPFPLPKHFRSDVELALHTHKMTKETNAAFLSSVAAAMLVFKQYPTVDDYICVGRSVITNYPFMTSPAGTPYVSMVLLYMTCMYASLCRPHCLSYMGNFSDIQHTCWWLDIT